MFFKILLLNISLLMKSLRYLNFLFVFVFLNSLCLDGQPTILKTSSFKHYVDSFNKNDNELYKQYYPNNTPGVF